MIGNFILRLTIWFLLTANLSWVNIVIGVAIALLLPQSYTSLERLKDLLWEMGRILVAIPQAYKEAIELILKPHTKEDIYLERVPAQRPPGLVFLDIFLITFTPKTTVLNYHEDGWYEIHRVSRRQQK
jgi:multicomponent Na+:H+ antiporter subunit E